MPYLEHAVKMEERAGNLVLQLMPVGLERKPKTVDEAKVRHMHSSVYLYLGGCVAF